MKNTIVLVFSLLAILSCSDPNVRSAQALAGRVVPGSADKFIFDCAPADSDYFRLSQSGDKVRIEGNNALSMAVGLN